MTIIYECGLFGLWYYLFPTFFPMYRDPPLADKSWDQKRRFFRAWIYCVDQRFFGWWNFVISEKGCFPAVAMQAEAGNQNAEIPGCFLLSILWVLWIVEHHLFTASVSVKQVYPKVKSVMRCVCLL
jgi:hypothetical protein